MYLEVINPCQKAFQIHRGQFTFSEVLANQPRTINFSLSQPVPIQPNAEVLLKEGNNIICRSFLDTWGKDFQTGKYTYNCKGIESLLKDRYSINFNYAFKSGELTYNQILSGTPVDQGVPGLLTLADDTFPVGYAHWDWYDQANAIVRLQGGGKKGRTANSQCWMVTQDLNKLTEAFTLTDLATLSWGYYRDNHDLYVRAIGDAPLGNCWMTMGGLMCEDAFKTMIQLGDIDGGDDDFVGYYTLKPDQNLYDVIMGILGTMGNNITWRDENGYTFLDATSA